MTFELMLPTGQKDAILCPELDIRAEMGRIQSTMFDRKELGSAHVSQQEGLTARFPELSTIHQAIKAKSAILDGEVVGLDANGKPCFEDLQNRKKCHIVYFAFDVLMLNHNDLRGEPLIKRRRRFTSLAFK